MIQTQPSARALLPLLVFLALFIGTGTWLTLQGVEFAFYQLPAPVAALPAVMLALMLGNEGFNRNLETFFKGVGDRVIPPFLGAFKSRGHAAFARCCFGV